MTNASSPRPGKPYLPLAIQLALLGLVAGIYCQTARFGFVNYDDGSYVFENPVISAGLSWHGVVWAFTHVHSQNWHPLTSISHMLDCRLFGLNPGRHHITSVFFHAAAAMLLFEFLRRATGSIWASAVTAAIFAVHPLRVESVAWISERKDVLSGFFFMVTLLAYANYVSRRQGRRMLLVVIGLAFGLMAKPMLVTTPLVLLFLDYWPLSRTEPLRTRVLEKLPLFLLSIGSCYATIAAQKLALGTTENLPLSWRLSNAVVSYAVYLRQLIWPNDLIPFYIHPESHVSVVELIGTSVLITAITIGVIMVRRRRGYLMSGWFWFLIMLLPVIGIIQVGLQGHADRYTYLPSIGVIIGIVWTGRDWVSRLLFPKSITIAVSLSIVAILAGLSYRQTSHWRDTASLWNYALKISPDNDVAYAGLAGIELVQGRLDEAITDYRRALELRDGNSAAHYGLALALARQRKFDQAIAHWEKSLEIQPDNTSARNYLGTALATIGRDKAAVQQWQQSLHYDPDNGDAMNNLAWLFATSRDPELRNGGQAVGYAERATRLPGGDNPMVYRTLAAAAAENGRFEEARAAAEHARALALAKGNTAIAGEMLQWIALFKEGRTLLNAAGAH